MYSTLSSDRFVASLSDRIAGPRVDNHKYYPVIYTTGGAGTPLSSGFTGATAHVSALIDARMTVAMPDVAWLLGNATAKTRIGATRTYLAAGSTGKADKVILMGQSNGAISSILYAAANPTHVAGVIAFIPPVDATYLYVNDVASLRVRYETAWDVTHPTALPDGASMLDASVMAALGDIPVLIYYASDDDITTGGAGLAGFLANTNSAAVSVGALGHTNTAVAAANTEQIVEFCKTVSA